MTEDIPLAKQDKKKVFKTIAEDETWHLESMSGTYDEIAALWNGIVENEIHANSFKRLLEMMNSVKAGDEITNSVAIQMLIRDSDLVQKKLDNIFAYAKNLAYSNPHVSWQLKKLLQDKQK